MISHDRHGRVTHRHGQPVGGHQRHPGSLWIDQNRASLPNNEWVAADGSGWVANDATIDGLMAKIRDRHLEPEAVAVAFITSDSA